MACRCALWVQSANMLRSDCDLDRDWMTKMGESQRAKFMKRLSTAGGGMRESLQLAVAAVVSDLRDHVERGVFSDEEIGNIVAFHDRAETLWREMMATNPPLDRTSMTGRLRQLEDACTGPLEGFRLRLESARQKAEVFERMKETKRS